MTQKAKCRWNWKTDVLWSVNRKITWWIAQLCEEVRDGRVEVEKKERRSSEDLREMVSWVAGWTGGWGGWGRWVGEMKKRWKVWLRYGREEKEDSGGWFVVCVFVKWDGKIGGDWWSWDKSGELIGWMMAIMDRERKTLNGELNQLSCFLPYVKLSDGNSKERCW